MKIELGKYLTVEGRIATVTNIDGGTINYCSGRIDGFDEEFRWDKNGRLFHNNPSHYDLARPYLEGKIYEILTQLGYK